MPLSAKTQSSFNLSISRRVFDSRCHQVLQITIQNGPRQIRRSRTGPIAPSNPNPSEPLQINLFGELMSTRWPVNSILNGTPDDRYLDFETATLHKTSTASAEQGGSICSAIHWNVRGTLVNRFPIRSRIRKKNSSYTSQIPKITRASRSI